MSDDAEVAQVRRSGGRAPKGAPRQLNLYAAYGATYAVFTVV